LTTKLHLGCGSAYKEGWVNIDLDAPSADIQRDLTQPLPFGDGSVSFIFTEHFVEHISRPQAVEFFVECRRVLREGGVLRVSTPNLRFLCECYLKGNITEWGDVWGPNSGCNLMNEGMRSWGHTYVYDREELHKVLAEAGFAHIRSVGWRESAHSDLVGLETRPYHQDLILEIEKSSKSPQPDRKQRFWQKWL